MSKNKNEKEMKEMSNFITEYLNSLSDETKEGIFLTAINNYLDEEIKYFDDCEEEQKEIMELYKNFKSADEVGKRVIIDAVLKNILISVSFFNQTYLESQCKRFRHRYGDWEEYEKTHEEKMDYYPYYSHKVRTFARRSARTLKAAKQ